MKESYWGYWLILLGLFVIGIMLLVNNISTTSTQDYYNLKEVTQSSMIDALDLSYFRLYGTIKISEQKFVESFARRFAENMNAASSYDIDFYDLYEVPPKVSVKISTATRRFTIGRDTSGFDVVTTISSILELNPDQDNGNPDGTSGEKIVGQCKVWLYDSLRKYLQGETVDGYSRDSENLGLDTRFNSSTTIPDDISEFRSWFAENYRIDGISAEAYLNAGGDMDNFPSDLKTFIDRGWITIVQ